MERPTDVRLTKLWRWNEVPGDATNLRATYRRYQTMRGLMAANNARAETLTQIAAEKPSRMYIGGHLAAKAHCADRRSELRPATRCKLWAWGTGLAYVPRRNSGNRTEVPGCDDLFDRARLMANGKGQYDEADRDCLPIGLMHRGRRVAAYHWPLMHSNQSSLRAPGPGVGGDFGPRAPAGQDYASHTHHQRWGENAGGALTYAVHTGSLVLIDHFSK